MKKGSIYTLIRVRKDQRPQLKECGIKDEDYDKIIDKLLACYKKNKKK